MSNVYDGITVNQKTFYSGVKRAFVSKNNCFVFGQPGSGKTEILGQIAQEMDRDLIVINPNSEDVIDMKVPVPVEVKGDHILKFAYSDKLPRPSGKPAIVFIDEMNTANMTMQPAMYSMMQEKRIGGFQFPEDTLMCGAGNREFDSAAANQLSGALKNRFGLTMNLRPCPEIWCDWATENGILDVIRSFVLKVRTKHNMPGYGETIVSPVEGYDPQAPNGGCTPRSLHNLSNFLKCNPSFEDDEDRSLFIRGFIGDSFGTKFNGWLKIYESEVDVDTILKDPTGCKLPKDRPDIYYMIACSLADKATSKNFPDIYKFIERKDFDSTYGYILVHSIVSNTEQLNEVMKSKKFSEYLRNNKHILIESTK